jgi:hypothetical protein
MMNETETQSQQFETTQDGGGDGARKLAAPALAVGAAVAGAAGGLAWAARDTRKRVLGVPLGSRSRAQKVAGDIVGRFP